MSKNDARFASNVAGPGGPFETGKLVNKTWDISPAYSGNGDPVFIWDATSGNFEISKCVIDGREGPRIAGSSGAAFNIEQCFINVVGFGLDHADGTQAFGADVVNVGIYNSTIRAYSTQEAQALFGGSATGSGCIFWADGAGGTLTLNNVLLWGGDRGVAVYTDGGPTTIDFQNVYFASSPNNAGFPGYIYDIRPTVSPLTVARWNNVRSATVVDGIVVPGALIASP